jgi:hypothetical protein
LSLWLKIHKKTWPLWLKFLKKVVALAETPKKSCSPWLKFPKEGCHHQKDGEKCCNMSRIGRQKTRVGTVENEPSKRKS